MQAREKVEVFERVVVGWNSGDLERFANSWRETLGPTQIRLEEARELDDGRLYVGVHQTATGPQSGVEVEIHFAQIMEFEGGKTSRAELFGDRDEGRAAARLEG